MARDAGRAGKEGHREYLIRVKGMLGPERSAWFDGICVSSQPGGETVLAGQVRDQAALHGILDRLHDLGLELLAVRCLDADLSMGTRAGRPPR